MNDHSEFYNDDLSDDATSQVVQVACIGKRSNGATLTFGSTFINGVPLDKKIQTEQIVELGPEIVTIKNWEILEFYRIATSISI